MEVNIVLAYDSVDEVCRLFSEYTDMLINGDPEFREYLEIQNYDEELNHLDTKYGLPGGRLYLAYCDGRAAGCVPGAGDRRQTPGSCVQGYAGKRDRYSVPDHGSHLFL